MQTYGIDTSILVRLLTGDPEPDYTQTATALETLLDREPKSRIVASNIVIDEAYIVVQHYYGVTKAEARAALLEVLQSDLIEPERKDTLDVIRAASKGAGLMDRLIVNDYQASDCKTLTHDKRMGKVEGAQLL